MIQKTEAKMTVLKTLGLERYDRFQVGSDRANNPIEVVYYGNDQWAHSGIPWRIFESAYIIAFWGSAIEEQLRNE